MSKPTKSEALKWLNTHPTPHDMEGVLHELEELGVEFAPEPTPEPTDVDEYIIVSEGIAYFGYDYAGHPRWSSGLGGLDKNWEDLDHPNVELYRRVEPDDFYVEDEPVEQANEAFQNGQKVTTKKPEPEPKYVAHRGASGWIYTADYWGAAPGTTLEGARELSDKWAAVVRLLESEQEAQK